MKAKTRPNRERADYLEYLEAQVAAEKDEAVASLLAALLDDARRRERSASMLATLSRLVEACNDIESGRAAELAAKAGVEQVKLRPGLNKITSVAVEAYVRVRRALDSHPDSEWTGPGAVTVRSTRSYNNYVKARADRVVSRKRSRPTDRDRRLEEIVGNLAAAEDRNELRWALEEGRKARRREAQMLRAIRTLQPDFDLDQLLSGNSGDATGPRSATDLAPADLQLLRRLVRRLISDDDLRIFGLTFSAGRVKMTAPPSSRLIEKDEVALLLKLAGLPGRSED